MNDKLLLPRKLVHFLKPRKTKRGSSISYKMVCYWSVCYFIQPIFFFLYMNESATVLTKESNQQCVRNCWRHSMFGTQNCSKQSYPFQHRRLTGLADVCAGFGFDGRQTQHGVQTWRSLEGTRVNAGINTLLSPFSYLLLLLLLSSE